MQAFELTILNWIQTHLRCGVLDAVMVPVSRICDHGEVWILLAAILLAIPKTRKLGTCMACGLALDLLFCNLALKPLIGRVRPFAVNPTVSLLIPPPMDASFPSGHTQNIVGTSASIFASRKETWVRIVCIVLMVLVPFSRMYLGVHTPLDVGVAFLTALALAAALYPAFRTESAAKKTVPWLLLGVAVLCGGYLIYASSLARCDWPAGSEDLSNITHGLKNAYTMLGALLGFLIVYIADEKKLHFDVRAPFWGQVLKLVLGLALIVGIKAGLKPLLVSLFAGSQAESFVRYFLLVLFAGIVWPLTFPFFAKLGRKGNAA